MGSKLPCIAGKYEGKKIGLVTNKLIIGELLLATLLSMHIAGRLDFGESVMMKNSLPSITVITSSG